MMDKGNMTNKISKPTHFYKYRNFDKYTERMFVNYEFYFPKASEFNDPFDCNVPVSFSGGRREDYRKLLADILPIYFEQSGLSLNDEQIKASVEDHLDEQLSNLPEFSRQLREGLAHEVRNNHGIFCVSERSDSILMFSHYADCHRGFCLEFRNWGIFNFAYKVKYLENLPTPNYFEHTRDELTELVLLTKVKDWAHEKEWRILQRNITPKVHTFEEPNFLTGVIFGLLMPEDHRNRIRNWVAIGGHKVQF